MPEVLEARQGPVIVLCYIVDRRTVNTHSYCPRFLLHKHQVVLVGVKWYGFNDSFHKPFAYLLAKDDCLVRGQGAWTVWYGFPAESWLPYIQSHRC
jgi:hypothetical protein